MSNRNNLPNHNGNNEDDLSQPVTDQRTIDPQDQQIDILIGNQLGPFEAEIRALYGIIFILLFCCIIDYYWYLFLFVFITYQLFNNNNRLGVEPRESQSWYLYWDLHGWDRDAEVEGRTAHPTTEDIQFSATVEIVDHTPLGIQETQANNTDAPVGLNHTEHPNVIINNVDGDIIPPNGQNETNARAAANEDVTPTTVGIDPLHSVESQDEVYSSDSSDEEDLIMSSERGSDGDDENDSTDDIERSEPTLPTTENVPSNSVPVNQSNLVNGQPSLNLHDEVLEVEASVAPPAEGVRQMVIHLPHSTGALHPKSPSTIRPTAESSDESVS